MSLMVAKCKRSFTWVGDCMILHKSTENLVASEVVMAFAHTSVPLSFGRLPLPSACLTKKKLAGFHYSILLSSAPL